MARYGRPVVVRTDSGPEFSTVFGDYLHSYGVRHRVITPGNARAAGQVERVNRVIKSGVRLYTSEGRFTWFEVLPELLMGLRFIAVRATGVSPYYMAFK